MVWSQALKGKDDQGNSGDRLPNPKDKCGVLRINHQNALNFTYDFIQKNRRKTCHINIHLKE
jgi:hypothetical protein